MDCSASTMTATGMDLREHLKLRLYGPIGHLVMACEQGRGYKNYGSFIQQEYQPNSDSIILHLVRVSESMQGPKV